MRNLPIFTIVNKMDRPALNGFEIIEQLEKVTVAVARLHAYGLACPLPAAQTLGASHRCIACMRTSHAPCLYASCICRPQPWASCLG
jgi:peptide subunit release factor RF-3